MSDEGGAGKGLSFLDFKGSGTVISVLLKPRSRRDMIEGINPEGLLKVRVSAAPVKGAANQGLIRLLSKSTGVPKSRLSIISGETSTRKRVLVEDLSAEAAKLWWQEVEKQLKTRKS